jgi:hypothetical protein
MNSLETYEQKFAKLHCDRPGGRPRLHKACMLLAVSVLVEAKELDAVIRENLKGVGYGE